MTVWGTPSPGARNVVTTRGYQDPSKRQLDYIKDLAKALGCKTPKVTTMAGASRAIDRLKDRLEEREING